MEDKLEEQTPNHKHLSGFYTQRGHDVMAGGKRRPYIVLATEILKSASNYRNTRFVSLGGLLCFTLLWHCCMRLLT